MTRTGRVLLVGTIVIVALLGIAWARLEWVEFEVDRGFGPEALRNPFLAAERLLNRQGVETETVEGVALLDDLPSPADALMITAPRESLSPRRADALVAWVEAGGVLFAIAHSVYDFEAGASADGVLDDLGVFLVDPDAEAEWSGDDEDTAAEESDVGALDGEAAVDEDEDEAASIDPDEAATTLGELLGVVLGPTECRDTEAGAVDVVSIGAPIEAEMLLELGSPYALRVAEDQQEDAYFSRDDQLVAMRFGEGLIVTLTSASPFTNRRIQCHDHAWFLWYSVEDRRKLWLLHDPEAPGLGTLAMTHLPGTMLGGGLLLVLVAARASLRFGREETTDEGNRRGRLAHLEATALFRYRSGGFGALYSRLHADLVHRGPEDRRKWARRARVPTERLSEVFDETPPRGRRVVLERVAMMIRMRRTR